MIFVEKWAVVEKSNVKIIVLGPYFGCRGSLLLEKKKYLESTLTSKVKILNFFHTCFHH